jgi:hypothetical protein
MSSRIRTQNEKLKRFLDSGRRINCFSKARQSMKIGYLNSRVSDLKKEGYPLGKQWITTKDSDGRKVRCVQYFKAA